MKKLLLFALFVICAHGLSAQCEWSLVGCNHPPIPTYPNSGTLGNYTNQSLYGANCHAFANRYFTGNYSFGNAKSDYDNGNSSVINAIADMANETIIMAHTFSAYTVPVATEAEADGVFYLVNGTITHSAVKIGRAYGGGTFGPQLYLSKWEPCGPVVQHELTKIGYYDDDPCNRPTSYAFFKYVGSGSCSSSGLSLSQASIANDRIRVSAPSGWGSHQWSVTSNGSIAVNGGSYVDIERTSNSPTNITVTLTASQNGCSGTDTETISVNPPLLSCALAPAPVISSNNICSSCSCAAYDGTFLVRAPFGWSNHQWTISAAGMIVWDLGEYIYIDRNPNHSGWPNNDIVVTLTATKNGCTKSYTTPPINLPSNCSGGGGPGFGFSVNSENELEITIDEEVMEEETGPVMEFSVYDMAGNSLGSTRTSEKKFIILLTERMGQGPYILRLQKEGKLYTRKVYFLKEED